MPHPAPDPDPTPDPYRLTGDGDGDGDGGDGGDRPSSPGLAPGEILRALLWTLVVLSAVANTVVSATGAGTWAQLACGAVTVVCGGALVVRHLRGRR
ncbi:hypothetical protein [Streptomyces ziwulingensis]|uniref:Uncharacterized protein n=1 Tax=Streptomyces ziwulingensis TaxID=1045501 RepID=A0ABP9BNG8_9ACTN